jgi:hypothetical protein
MSKTRNLSMLLSLSLLAACGKVTEQPDELTKDASASAQAGSRAMTGGAGGTETDAMPAADGGAASDAGTPPKPAADGGSEKDAGAAKDAGPAHEPLCDGTQDMRLEYLVEGGFVDSTYYFTNPHGHTFFAIDGKCRFFAGDNFMRGIISGTLTSAQADQLSADVHWDALAGWGDWPGSPSGCADGSGVTLIREKVSVTCVCGCGDKAPKGLDDAQTKAYAWVEKLMSMGKALDGPVSAIVLSDRDVGGSVNQPKFDWPLSRSITSIPGLLVESGSAFLMAGAGVRFDDAADYAKLRSLRAATVMADVPNSGSRATAVFVRDNGKEYYLLVRDELPEDTEKAWKALEATLPLPPNR